MQICQFKCPSCLANRSDHTSVYSGIVAKSKPLLTIGGETSKLGLAVASFIATYTYLYLTEKFRESAHFHVQL